ncbi:MAG TPA: tRNA (adenosine(37)-N6)-threonylcarbamoyltransferase complex ATPase subunit type 1 TsaE, partial [Dehalococcoidia bacterium]|nr:tRNA (adenosine(37)-N6)-threonylcarbamoyltransferase complex ATPase subunit type 1 TsaE [Dehalococcoidia bacterium]
MSGDLRLESGGPEDTRAIGERLGRLLEAADVVLLQGELGAGKTTFVQGIARGLGFSGSVSSKSFVLLGEYAGRVKLYHADLYRLDDPDQVLDLALEEIA